jgi:ATP-binding protein involved in chromosome partitioning
MGCNKHSGCGSQQENKEGGNVPDEKLKAFVEDMTLQDRMAQIKHKIMVLSGKGGVGKSTVAVNIAIALGLEGKKVGLLDADFHGPSIPTLLRLTGKTLKAGENGIEPIEFVENVKVISVGFFIPEQDQAVIWRGPMKISVIKQLLTEVNWGELDYLIIDFPPGTGDEPLSVAQLIPEADGAIIVTTPQDLSLVDVRKSINFCKQLNLPVLGVIENMSGLVCPHCQEVIDVFKTGGGEKMANETGVPFLGRIPIEPLIVESSDNGKPFIFHHGQTKAAEAFNKVVQPILAMSGK